MDFLDEIIDEEGGAKETNDPDDPGGRTKFGISERANPDLWKDGPPTYEQARQRYEERYIHEPGFDKISFKPLRENLADFGVTSGPARPILFLQTILAVPKDGILGPQTLAALAQRDPKHINNLLCAMREAFYRKLGDINPTKKKFVKGWVARAKRFWIP